MDEWSSEKAGSHQLALEVAKRRLWFQSTGRHTRSKPAQTRFTPEERSAPTQLPTNPATLLRQGNHSNGRRPKTGSIRKTVSSTSTRSNTGSETFALCAAVCSQATLARPSDDGQWDGNGDPTEIALQVAAYKLGHGKPYLTLAQSPLARVNSTRSDRPQTAVFDGHYEQLVEHPFNSTVKRMSKAYRFVPASSASEGHVLCILKGASIAC